MMLSLNIHVILQTNTIGCWMNAAPRESMPTALGKAKKILSVQTNMSFHSSPIMCGEISFLAKLESFSFKNNFKRTASSLKKEC